MRKKDKRRNAKKIKEHRRHALWAGPLTRTRWREEVRDKNDGEN